VSKYIHNSSQENKIYNGVEVLVGTFLLISSDSEKDFSNDEGLLADILNGSAKMSSNGVNDLPYSPAEQISFLRKIEVIVGDAPALYPFAQKKLSDGRRLFRRKHGVRHIVPANSEHSFTFEIPYVQCKIDEVEIINCSGNDNVDLKVRDNASGTYSSIPNVLLNQFGFNVCLSDLYYADTSNYDANLYQTMKMEVVYRNNDDEDKNIGVNFVLHEVV